MKPIPARLLTLVLTVLPAVQACHKQVVDAEARKFYREELSLFLDSLAYQVCEVKYFHIAHHPGAVIPGVLLCPGKSSPSPKAPTWALLASASASTEKDSEARKYIREDLQPWLDSVVYNLCHVKSAAAPAAPGAFICPGPPDGYKRPPANGNP